MPVLYTSDHEWIDTGAAEAATVGITTHAQDALGDVVFVDLPTVGTSFKKGEVAGVVESVEVNEALRADPSLANSDPLGAGWFFRIRPSDASETSSLMDQAAYDALVKDA